MRTATLAFCARRRAGVLAVLGWILLWGVMGGAAAQPTPDVSAWTVPDTVTVGESFTLNITASTPAHRAIGFPEADADTSVFGALTVLRRSPMHTRRVGAGYAIDSVAYTVRASGTGAVRVPPLPVWVDAGVDTVVAHTRPRTVWVLPRSVESTAPAGGSAAPNALFWGAWAAAAVLLIGGGRVFWTYVREDEVPAQDTSPEGTTEGLPPYRSAVDRLETLTTSEGPGPDGAAGRCVACAEVVRTYLARRLDLAARTSTTEELMTRLHRHADVPAAACRHLETVLRQADLVKFAGERPDAATVTAVVEAAHAALTDIEDAHTGSERPG